MLILLPFSCQVEDEQKQSQQKDVARILSDHEPRNIHCKYWSSTVEKGISDQVFQKLIDLDPLTFKPKEVLASKIPEINLTDSLPFIDFEIKSGAKWHDDKALKPDDILFTLKFMFNPFLEQDFDANYFTFIKNIEVLDEEINMVRFTLNNLVPDPVYSTGQITIIPKHIYDPDGLFDKYSFREFKENNERIMGDSTLKRRSEEILAKVYAWEPETLIGTGPYRFKERLEGQNLILEKVADYWGEDYSESNPWFQAFPSSINYMFISEPISKKLALENQEADVHRFSTSFLPTISDNPAISENFQEEKIIYFGFVYLGLNTLSSRLKNPELRRAISFLIDREEMVEYLQEGYGKITNHPFFGLTTAGESKIRSYPSFNPDSCIWYLEKGGWKIQNNDAFRSKLVNGQMEKLQLEYVYSSKNKSSEDTGLLLKDKARSVGIDIVLVPLEFGTYLDRMSNHEFDITRGGIGTLPRGFNYKAIFHTEAISKGKNYVAFGDKTSDKILEDLDIEIDPAKAEDLKVQLSNRLVDSRSWIILYNPEIPVLVSTRYKNYINSPVFQGIWPPSLN